MTEGFTISPEVSLFFRPIRIFVCLITEKTLMQIKYHLVFLYFRYSNAYQMEKSSVLHFSPASPHLSFELPLPAPFSPASRTSPAPILPPPAPPLQLRGPLHVESSLLHRRYAKRLKTQTSCRHYRIGSIISL